MTTRVHLLKLGTVKQGRAEHRRNNGSLGRSALTHWEIREKGTWRQVQRLVWDKLLLPIASWLQVLWGRLEFRRCVPVGKKRKGMGWGCS